MKRTSFPSVALTILAGLGLTTIAAAQVSQLELDAPAKLMADKQFADAADAYEKLLPRLGPEQGALRSMIEFNRATALMAAEKQDQAVSTLMHVDESADSPAVRSAARAALGHITARQAEALAKEQVDQAIQAYQRAERWYRNASAEASLEQRETLARRIELVQRRIAKLLEQQKQEQQQKQQQNQNQDNNNQQQNQQDKNQNQKSDQKQDGKDSSQENQSSEQKQNPDQQEKDGKDAKSKEQPSQQGDDQQKQDEKKRDESGVGDETQTQEKQAQQQQTQEQDAAKDAAQKRAFDRAAAEILDKERKHRERVRQMLLRRLRAAPVEKDW